MKKTMDTIWIRWGSIVMALGIFMGAFGAHALRDRLSDAMKGVYETGVKYQLIHGLALFLVAWMSDAYPSARVTIAGVSFLIGTFLFSGSLYALSLTEIRLLGMITPIGGLLFLIGWTCLLFH